MILIRSSEVAGAFRCRYTRQGAKTWSKRTIDELPLSVRTSVVNSWPLTYKESATNEASRHTLRLRPSGGFPVGVTVALSCLWQDCNNEGVDPRCGL